MNLVTLECKKKQWGEKTRQGPNHGGPEHLSEESIFIPVSNGEQGQNCEQKNDIIG